MNFSNENSSFLANSYSNTSTVNSFSKYSNLMEYLIKKLEARIKIFPRTRAAIANIHNLQDLIENKKEMIKHFFEIEDDMKQGVDAIKALLAQNRDLTEQLESCTARATSQEFKSIGDLNIISELNDKNNQLIEDCNSMRKKFTEIEAKSTHFREKILEFEDEFKMKEKLIQQLREENKNYSEEMESLVDENVLLKMKIDNLEKEIKMVENKKDQQNEKNYKNENYLDISNLNSVLAEKEINKKLIEEKIKNHFHNNSLIVDETNKLDNYNSQGFNFHIPDKHDSSTPSYSFYDNNSSKKDPEAKADEFNYKNQNLLSKIIMSALESEDNINILNKKFGKDFMEKLLSNEVNEDFLKKIEETLKSKSNTINHINQNTKAKDLSHRSNDEFKSNNVVSKKMKVTDIPDNIQDNQLAEEKEENYCDNKNKKENLINNSLHNNKTTKFEFNNDKFSKLSNSATLISHRRSKSTGLKNKSNKFSKLNFPKGLEYKIFDENVSFKNTLRNYKLGRSPSTGKVFVNYISPHGNYFDDTLQKGGKSKLDNKLIKSK